MDDYMDEWIDKLMDEWMDDLLVCWGVLLIDVAGRFKMNWAE